MRERVVNDEQLLNYDDYVWMMDDWPLLFHYFNIFGYDPLCFCRV